MTGNGRLLVIGPPKLRSAVAAAAPRAVSDGADNLLAGLWTAGQRRFDAFVVALTAGRNPERGIRSLREIAPQARIVVTCPIVDEPLGRAALHAGADEYVLEPVQTSDLQTALQLPAIAPRYTGPAFDAAPSIAELTALSDVLKRLADGPDAVLAQLARLLQDAFDASSVVLHVDDAYAAVGDPTTPVLEEIIRRQDMVVGSIALGPRRNGRYTARDAAHLTDYAGLIDSIVAQASERHRWQELAWRDDLTGLRNRRFFEQALEDLLGRAMRERLRVTVVLFDIDDFKRYNDRFGHETGDGLLREVATLLTRCSRESDFVARYGGDEFAVVLWDAEKPRVPGSQHPHDAFALADRFRTAISEHSFQCLGKRAPGPVTLSGGLACFPWDGKITDQLMRAADEALLRAKREGKNHLHIAGNAEPSTDDLDVTPEASEPSSEEHPA